jgi:hypothetical protein
VIRPPQLTHPASNSEEVAIMYVRNAPEALVRVVKSRAALRGRNLSEWMIEAAQQRLEREGIDLPAEDEER